MHASAGGGNDNEVKQQPAGWFNDSGIEIRLRLWTGVAAARATSNEQSWKLQLGSSEAPQLRLDKCWFLAQAESSNWGLLSCSCGYFLLIER